MENLKYVIEDSTIVEVLGVQNFTNEESAILELVKNAYDAQAICVLIRISREKIVVEDDGIGMNRQKILEAWMKVGKSDKEYMTGTEKESRVLAGSKGVGRFAIARLGATASIYTKMEQEESILWKTDWNTSVLEAGKGTEKRGTRIVIEQLRDNWTEARVRKVREFLSKTYNDDKMRIFVEYKEDRREVMRYFTKKQLGVNYVDRINLHYYADRQRLICDIESDEFKENVQDFCTDVDINRHRVVLDIAEELEGMKNDLSEEITEEEWKALLTNIGDFSSEFYFSLKSPDMLDAEKYYFKHRLLEDCYEKGVVLYRNAFSISSYEGGKDWLELGKRCIQSPADVSHPTGTWRVREDQISGKVIIDKKINSSLSDLMNRQGLVENDTYRLFTAIIISGIGCFERYRQNIIRCILKNKKKKQTGGGSVSLGIGYGIITSLIISLMKEIGISQLEKQLGRRIDKAELQRQLKKIETEYIEEKSAAVETEKRYKYDIRLLNMFATSGLKAASIAHEMYNDRNSIDENVKYIIKALKKYELWDIVNETENRQYIHRDIPALLEKNERVNRKMVTFMDVMLSESEKEQFLPESIDIVKFFKEMKLVWERDYSWLNICLEVEEGLKYESAKDILRVIFDNLLLNSIQQNNDGNLLEINIQVSRREKYLYIVYWDNGKGLSPKYVKDPMRILEVHETSRRNGHGIGMWMVNNTIINTGGEIEKIEGENGFKMEFVLGETI